MKRFRYLLRLGPLLCFYGSLSYILFFSFYISLHHNPKYTLREIIVYHHRFLSSKEYQNRYYIINPGVTGPTLPYINSETSLPLLIISVVCKYLKQFLSKSFGVATLPICSNIGYGGRARFISEKWITPEFPGIFLGSDLVSIIYVRYCRSWVVGPGSYVLESRILGSQIWDPRSWVLSPGLSGSGSWFLGPGSWGFANWVLVLDYAISKSIFFQNTCEMTPYAHCLWKYFFASNSPQTPSDWLNFFDNFGNSKVFHTVLI